MSRISSTLSAAAVAAIVTLGSAQAAVFKSAPCDEGTREALLQQVNAYRAQGFLCGGQRFGSARPVSWNGQLYAAAARHSQDMAEQDYFDHVNPRGQKASARASEVGYAWRTVGENIAAGETYTVANVVRGWMASPSHCSNIMDPGYAEVAVACVTRPGTTYGRYWTMMLGRR